MMYSTSHAASGKEQTAEKATDLMQIGDHGQATWWLRASIAAFGYGFGLEACEKCAGTDLCSAPLIEMLAFHRFRQYFRTVSDMPRLGEVLSRRQSKEVLRHVQGEGWG
jgi:hypothetical protein